MARVKEEADRISEQANSHIENIRRQIEQEKTIGRLKNRSLLKKQKPRALNKE